MACKGKLDRQAFTRMRRAAEDMNLPVHGSARLATFAVSGPQSAAVMAWSEIGRPRYIVELRGKLVMIVRQHHRWVPKPCFTVIELVHVDDGHRSMNTHKYMWANMASLGNHALFLGWTCSKAVHVPEGGHIGVKRNHIYYARHRCLRRDDRIPHGAKVFSRKDDGGDRVYYKEDNSVYDGGQIIPSIEYYVKGGICPPIWIFPPDM
ncbi:uncharacterized protein [Lolium perenne]|uniref:uncharacterized protein n=1 Tax=Lolium perenne TaxID=4522 RepID=UPI0021F5EF14|nr:uncharacterized protein LOC127340503 [Lolium perenne]